MYLYIVAPLFDHAAIVLKNQNDDNDLIWAFEANPNENDGWWNGKGIILGRTTVENRISRGSLGYQQVFDYKEKRQENVDCDTASRTFIGLKDKINGWNLAYEVEKQNSNSFARTLLQDAGYSIDNAPRMLIGWGNYLNANSDKRPIKYWPF